MAGTFDKINRGIQRLLGKTNDAISLGRIQLDINNYNNKINVTYREVGKAIAQKVDEGETTADLNDPQIVGLLTQIKDLKAKVEEMKKKYEEGKQSL